MIRWNLFAGVVLALVVLAAPFAAAELATEEEAALVAGNWATYIVRVTGAWGGDVRPLVAGSTEIVVSDTLVGWCFYISPSGHVVVPAIKELPPVKSYSDLYGMSVGEPDGYGRLMEDVLRDRVRTLVREYGSMEAAEPPRGGERLGGEARALWDRFAVPPDVFEDSMSGSRLEPLTEVGPLLTTAWHQGAPYNNFCPMGDGGRTVVGCVATAAAQILRYHASPSAGFGSHSYYWYGDDSCGGSSPGAQLTAYFDDTYDWDNMPNSCSGGCSAAEQDALAELCYEVGVAFDMDYGRCGSGTYTSLALTVFPTYFGYSTSIDRENRSAHSVTSWFGVIQDEVNQDRPMQYRILGHSIVCDGWRDTGGTKQYHMNYGWADSHNAWYVLDDLYMSDDPNDEYLIRRIIPPDSAWEDVTGGPPVGDTGDAMGASWSDYDGDGDPDLYFTNDGTANVLARNDDPSGFTDVTSGPLGNAGSGAAGVWGDYDNDGDPDLYVVNNGAGNVLMRNDGGGAFSDVTSGPLADSGPGYGAAWADYDLDGDLDLYVANGGTANRLLRNDGGGVFADATSGPLADTGPGRGVAWSDYDLDGDPDLYVANYGGSNRLLRNDGGGAFTDVTAGPLGDTGNGTGVAWGDYDLDGDLDLYVVNDGGANRLLRNLGAGSFIDVTSPPLDDAGEGQGAAWGDFDGDGRLDLVVANRNGGNLLLRGRASNTANFIHVNLEGTVSNRSGIGARVRIVTADGAQVREVSGGSGYLSQDSLTAEFGLRWASEVDTLRILWPSGIVNTYTGLAINQFATFTESPPPSAPASLAAVPSEAGVTLMWSPVGDPQLDHYRVERDTSSAFGPGTVAFTTGDTSYVDFPIYDVREYYYRVLAVGTGGNDSEPSDVVVAAPLQTPPGTPTDVVAVPGDALAELSWTGVSSPDLDHYRIERATSPDFSGGSVFLTTPLTFLTDGPLADNEYFYRVFAVDWGGLESAPSETVSCTPQMLPPSAPEGLYAESGDGIVSLDWDPNPEVDIAHYVVYRDTLADGATADTLAAPMFTFYDDTTAENYTVYWYWLEAVDDGGLHSAPSDKVAGVAAPGGAVFVDCAYSGVENGSYSYPYNMLDEGIAAAGEGSIVVVLPGECAGGITIDGTVRMIGMAGPASTSIVVSGGSVITAAAGSDSAKLQGLTFDGLGSAENAIECADTGIEVVDCVLTGASSGANVHSGAAPLFRRNVFRDNYYGLTCSDTAVPVLSGNTFYGNAFANINTSGDPGPVVGGSLATANDFLDNSFFSVFNTGAATVSARFNYWGDACADSAWFYGPVSFVPWTDSLHVQTYYECPGTGVEDGLPVRYALRGNSPNPFNPSTRIVYDVPAPGGPVRLSVYNISGALVRELIAEETTPGRHVATWDGTDEAGRAVSSGVYFCRLEAGDFSGQRKMVLLK